MTYKFDKVAADAIIRIIKTAPIVRVTGEEVYYSTTVVRDEMLWATTDLLPGVLKFARCSFTRRYVMTFGNSRLGLENFSWINKERILSAINTTQKAFQNAKRIELKSSRQVRECEALNTILKRLPRDV